MKRKHKPSLKHLENYDFAKTQVKICNECGKRTRQEIYDGHTFAEGCKLLICLHCKVRILV